MKNLHKLVLGLMVGAMAISFSAFTNAKTNTRLTTYYYNAGEQPWSSTGGLPADQNSSHYSTVSGSPSCNQSTNICTYNLVSGKFEQATEGTIDN
ncbi:hypothetical protein JN11_00850 [Mucilaginibacter frigoritolerans]|uniref:Uncharacterized protein n=1 Tax=Mucilaginibacter frigoritolerans TaxID=652788 RepID=A0A562UBZ2_9SPHI|nr:hypothetical protein [Mucilaginibacter frigoritolerans]TWJ03312.1 hypothetical protein JN11_00850 [Mucilaginibacter frigoritolerans]